VPILPMDDLMPIVEPPRGGIMYLNTHKWCAMTVSAQKALSGERWSEC
jgi:hypothetical protein